jgi:hypothetical protein
MTFEFNRGFKRICADKSVTLAQNWHTGFFMKLADGCKLNFPTHRLQNIPET